MKIGSRGFLERFCTILRFFSILTILIVVAKFLPTHCKCSNCLFMQDVGKGFKRKYSFQERFQKE